MTGSSLNRNALLVIGTALACAVVVFTIGIAYPRPVSSPTLGGQWECHRAAGIVTTCRRTTHAEPLIHRTRSFATDKRWV